MPITLKQFLKRNYLEQAFEWIEQTRENYAPNDSVWFFRRDYDSLYINTLRTPHKRSYCFSPVKKIYFNDYNSPPVWIWNAQDCWILKALSLYFIDELMPLISTKCTHVRGNGGIIAGLSHVTTPNPDDYKFVFKSDVKSYYESMNHKVLMRLFQKHIQCKKILDILYQFLAHLEDDNAILKETKIGISKGCPLSPLLGALYLSELDECMSKLPVIYTRFQDDWCVLAKTRWHLRKAIKLTNQILDRLKVQKHPDKTFIGRVKKAMIF